MEEDDKGCPMIRMGVSGWMFLLVPAYSRSPGQKAFKRLCVCWWLDAAVQFLSDIKMLFARLCLAFPSVLWCCWLGGWKGIRPVKTEWWGADVVVCLEPGADLHMAQLMPLPLTVSCFSRIQIGFTAQCDVSAVYAVALCLSVSLSVCHKSVFY